MKTPKRLLSLVEEGLIDEVLGQLMSGKEATVFVVRCGEHVRCAVTGNSTAFFPSHAR